GGAVIWWFCITFFVSKVRNRFNMRGIWLINRIIGGVVIMASVRGFISTLLGSSILLFESS
ncbi:hypothetical protein EZS27_036899, partial [termite gut metagenome]